MDNLRHCIAVVLLLVAPGMYFWWYSIHPFIRFWKKVGPRRTLAIHLGLVIALAIWMYQVRQPLLSTEYGTNWALILLAIPLYAVPLFVLVVALLNPSYRQPRIRVLLGLSELAPEIYKTRLITTGFYSRLRHPRYVLVLIFLLASALVCNYLVTYVIFLSSLIWVLLLVRIEEKELRERFGSEYEQYCAQVPRFWPW